MATAPGYGFATIDLVDLNEAIDEPIRLHVEQPVRVRLVDLEGSPIVGAEISPHDIAGLGSDVLSHDFQPPLFRNWTSDRDGRFVVRGCGPDYTIHLEVRAPGSASST